MHIFASKQFVLYLCEWKLNSFAVNRTKSTVEVCCFTEYGYFVDICLNPFFNAHFASIYLQNNLILIERM